MGRAQSDTYSSLFTKSDNVNLDETFDRISALVHVLIYRTCFIAKFDNSYISRTFTRCMHFEKLLIICTYSILFLHI